MTLTRNSLIGISPAPTQVLSCEYCEISINIYFEEHLRTAASPETTYVLVQLQILCYDYVMSSMTSVNCFIS